MQTRTPGEMKLFRHRQKIEFMREQKRQQQVPAKKTGWREVKAGEILEAGRHIKMDVKTGKSYVMES